MRGIHQICQYLKKLNSKKFISICLGLILFIFFSAFPKLPTFAQVTDQIPIRIPRVNDLFSANNSNIQTAPVFLDGYELFTVTALALETQNNLTTDLKPVSKRVQKIENNLIRFVHQDKPIENIRVTYNLDEASNLPIIYINDQYLMTVTNLDAQLQGMNQQRWASELTKVIENALIRAKQERQIPFLIRQALKALLIILISTIFVCILKSVKQRISRRQEQLESEIAQETQVLSQQEAEADVHLISTEIKVVKKQQGYNIYDIQKLLLVLGQIAIVGSSIFLILGLFPYTRGLQPFIYSTPLKVVFIGLGVYVLIKVGNILIDKLLNIVNSSYLVTPSNYQRLSLRITTFSQVLKSVNAVVWISVGILSGLSLFGVNIVPLLAGAGIIGLAISFASQGLIKDIINGSFILLEDQYAVGDVIVVDKVAGFVENMNLRITQLRDNEGRLITIPNSAISVVQNLSKDWSRVDLTVEVAYDTEPNHALSVIHRLAEEMFRDKIWQEKILEFPEVLGIDKIDHKGMLIRIWIKTQPLQQWAVAREFRRRLRMVMQQEGINIGIPQGVTWLQENLGMGRLENGYLLRK